MRLEIEIAGAKHLLTVDEARKLWVELRELFEDRPPLMSVKAIPTGKWSDVKSPLFPLVGDAVVMPVKPYRLATEKRMLAAFQGDGDK